MGCWGMGITQSDEYCEVYARFLEDYDKGKPVAEITKDLLEEYLDEFEENDSVLHDVYFALGRAEWMCGGISDFIFKQIKEIIESDKNIVFLKELDATESDLKIRKRNLNKFLQSLSEPRGKVKKRKIPEDKYIIESNQKRSALPKLQDGDVLAYKVGEVYRIFAVVRHQKSYSETTVFCYAWKKQFKCIPTLEELFHEHIMPLGYFNGETFPHLEKVSLIGNIPSTKNLGALRSPELVSENWKRYVFIMSSPDTHTYEYPLNLCLTLNDVLEKIKKV